MSVSQTFNERFYFLVELRAEENKWDVYETPISADIYEAIAKYLRWLALEDDTHKRCDTIKVGALVSLSPNGPFEPVCIAPGWRQCEPVVQAIVERCLLAKHEWATQYLLEMDSQQFDEVAATS